MQAILVAVLLYSGSAVAQTIKNPAVYVCLKYPEEVEAESRQFAQVTLKRFERELGVMVQFGCRADAMTFTFRPLPDVMHPPDTIGVTRIRDGAILPDAEIYYVAVDRMLRMPSAQTKGMSYGKVAAHELYHFLMQQPHHAGGDLNCEFLTEELLLTGPRTKAQSLPETRASLIRTN